MGGYGTLDRDRDRDRREGWVAQGKVGTMLVFVEISSPQVPAPEDVAPPLLSPTWLGFQNQRSRNQIAQVLAAQLWKAGEMQAPVPGPSPTLSGTLAESFL